MPRSATISIVTAAVTLFCMMPAAGADTTEMTTVRDRVWVWTNSEIDSAEDQTLSTFAQAAPSQRAKLLDIPNVMLGGFGMPNDTDAARAITGKAADAKRLVWKVAVDGELVTSGKDGKSAYAWYDHRMEQVRTLADAFPQIGGVMIDDLSTVGLRGGIKAEHIHNLRSLLPAPYDRIRIWGELYTSSLHAFILRPDGNDYGLTDVVRAVDVIVLTEWNAADLPKLAQNVEHCRRVFPDHDLVMNIALYDYDGHRRIPRAMLKYQCETALQMLHAGTIKGIIITATLNDPEAVAWTAAWLKRVGDEELARPATGAAVVSVSAPDPATLPGPAPLDISKIFFMYHPICWSMQMSGDVPGSRIPKPHDHFLATFEREVAVVERQKRFMREMKPDEALVIFPNGYSRAMFIIEQYAREMLGRRCVIVRNQHTPQDFPAAWRKLDTPVDRLLDDPELEGRSEWLGHTTPDVVEEVLAEVRKAHGTEELDISLSTVEVAFTSRGYAREILEKFGSRNIHFDGDTVTGESFGEGFEECAMTWKQMLVPYLGIQGPIPNRYDLSVSGVKFLLHSKPKERLPMAHETFLYLWEDEEGSPIGLFARGRCAITDPAYYVTVKVADPDIEVVGYGGGKYYPNAEYSIQPVEGRMRLNVFSAIRRGPDGLFYIRGAAGTSYDQFRKSMLESPITR